MVSFQIYSVESPLDNQTVYAEAFRVLVRTQKMGLWQPPARVRLDSDLYSSVLSNLHEAGIANGMRSAPGQGPDTAEAWAKAWQSVGDAIDDSPHPAGEWKPARELLGDALLSETLNVSESSLRRYSTSARQTPDDVAWRLHAIGQITSALAGSYNEYGIRRWFERKRDQLGGSSPKALLHGDWSPDDDDPKRVIELAEALLGAGTAG